MTLTSPDTEVRQDSRIALLDTDTGDLRDVVGGYNARFVETGHLLFMRGSDLWAVPFDLRTLSTRGREARVQEALTTRGSGGAAYSVINDGLLVYAPDRPITDLQRESNANSRSELTTVDICPLRQLSRTLV